MHIRQWEKEERGWRTGGKKNLINAALFSIFYCVGFAGVRIHRLAGVKFALPGTWLPSDLSEKRKTPPQITRESQFSTSKGGGRKMLPYTHRLHVHARPSRLHAHGATLPVKAGKPKISFSVINRIWCHFKVYLLTVAHCTDKVTWGISSAALSWRSWVWCPL